MKRLTRAVLVIAVIAAGLSQDVHATQAATEPPHTHQEQSPREEIHFIAGPSVIVSASANLRGLGFARTKVRYEAG